MIPNYTEILQEGVRTRTQRRKAANAFMLSLTGALTLLALVPLFWIIGYEIYKG